MIWFLSCKLQYIIYICALAKSIWSFNYAVSFIGGYDAILDLPADGSVLSTRTQH